MSTTLDRSKETEGEELRAKRRINKAEPVHKELTPEAVLPPEVEAKALTNPSLAPSANLGRKAQVLRSLQRTHGNAYVQRLVAQSAPPQDKEEKTLPPEVAERIATAKGGGYPLEPETRTQIEANLGHDFSDVRVHADAEADRLATELGAKAFTAGKDIFFRAGAYEPQSEAGKETLGHELAHVAQQAGNAESQPLSLSQPADAAEVEAAEIGAQIAQPDGQTLIPVETSAPAHAVHRQVPGLGEIGKGLMEGLRTGGETVLGALAEAAKGPSPATRAMWNASVVKPLTEAYNVLEKPTKANINLAGDKVNNAYAVVSSVYNQTPPDSPAITPLLALINQLNFIGAALMTQVGLKVPMQELRDQLEPSNMDYYLSDALKALS